MRVKPDQITRAIRIAKAIGEKIDPAFGRVDMGLDEESPVARRLGSIADIRPVQPYTPRVSGFAAGGDVELNPYGTPNDLGLYSHAAMTAASLPQAKGTPEQYRGMLLNKGVKPDELNWSGFDDAFSGQPQVTREDIARHFSEKMPPIEERVLHSNPPIDDLKKRQMQEVQEWQDANAASPQPEGSWQALLRRHNNERLSLTYEHQPPFHERYTLPGGENYREVLLKHGGEESFRGVPSHFGGEPNILTSLRMQDRTDHEGDKVLHLDEIQSDWAQRGREAGFKGSESYQHRDALDDYLEDLGRRSGKDVTLMWPHAAMEIAQEMGEAPQLSRLLNASAAERKRRENTVENAPYVGRTNDWVDLGLKRALVEAAKGGYDKLAWSPGDVHAARYDLSKHVGEIHHENNQDGTFNIRVLDPQGYEVHSEDDVDRDSLPGLVGGEMATKIFSGEGDTGKEQYEQKKAAEAKLRDLEHSIPMRWVEHKINEWEKNNPGQSIPIDEISILSDYAQSTPRMDKLASDIGVSDEYNAAKLEYLDHKRKNNPYSPYRDWRILRGLDLKVGGEGMRKFYDEMVPKRLARLIKQHDPDAEFAQSKIALPQIEHDIDDYGIFESSQPVEGPKTERALPAIRITPKMRESILKKGFAAYASGGEVDGDFEVSNPMSIFPKPQRMWDEDMPGGAYLSMPDKEDVTGHRAANASIGIQPGGKPYFNASRDQVDVTGSPGRGSATVKTNLFKQKAGWRWLQAPEGHEDTNTIVSVEHRGKHHYVMNAHFPKGVDLSRYPDAPSEPRLRPTTKGNVELGPQVGSILVRGKEHPVHAHAIVKAAGGEVEGDDHPLTQDVYHGTQGEGVGPLIGQEIGQQMFTPEHPGDVAYKPNATALMLGPHVARDPNIAGDYRFTTGEHLIPTDEGMRRMPKKATGHVKMLRTFPDEKFFPVPQPSATGSGWLSPHDYDDRAVHRLVMSTTFSKHPELLHQAVEEAYGDVPERFLAANNVTEYSPETIDKFLRNNNMGIRPTLRQEVINRFRKIMRDQGYVGLSYINTDEDETDKETPTQPALTPAKDKKCYIVFPQRDKETGWSPLRNRYAKFDPARKGRPGLHEARGGAVDGYALGGSPDDDMPEMGEAEPTTPENPNGGLLFPSTEAQARLRRKASRPMEAGMPKNERTVVKAPEGSELPDFVAGNISFDDWKKRHEGVLSDDEVHHSASWYKNILGNFQKYYSGDDPKAKKMMRAWLVAQQNVSPAGAMGNVLLQKEQMARGVPQHLWRAGGMPNPTEAARSVLQGKEISGGVGQKIADFVDSAEGKQTRSWMDDHPSGGQPFVVDVHTARDTGMVDQELINHLRRAGYNEDDLKKLEIDFQGTPTEAVYENRANWGRELTSHLNSIGWKGRNDWTPAEVQAVGWMGMTKLTRNVEEDSESGLGRNLRRISYELSPGEGSPWEKKYSDGFYALPKEDQYALTKDMANAAMRHAQKLSGIDLNGIVHGTGAWEHFQNPAAVTHTLATEQGADIAANALGYLLQQTEVWHNRVKPVTASPKGFAVDFVEQGTKNLADQDSLKDFWGKVIEADKHGLIRGYQPIVTPEGQVGIRALVDKGGVKTRQKLEESLKKGGAIDGLLKSLPYDTETTLHEAEIRKARNDWKEHSNGEAYLSRLIDLMGSDPSANLNRTRAQLEQAFESLLDKAHARQGTSWRKAKGGAVISRKNENPAIDKAVLISMRAMKKR